MNSAEKLFTQTFFSSTNRFAAITSFRRVAQLGLPAATPMIYEEWRNFAHQLFHDAEYDNLFIDKQKALEISGGVEVVGGQMAQEQINRFRAVADAASLVFAHSVLDSVALDYCRVTALASPANWTCFVEQKKFTLIELKGRVYEELLHEKITECLDLLDREPLLKKIDRLFQVCQPSRDFAPMHDYYFDRARLIVLDDMRHDIVHGSGPVATLPRGDDDIWFLQKTSSFLMALVNMRFGLKINPADFVTATK